MLEKLGGLATIAVAVTVLCLISVFEPPTYVQILCGLVGSIVFLLGVVFLFSEGRILTKDRKVQKAPKTG
jgi:uncharacterized membrane protein YccC